MTSSKTVTVVTLLAAGLISGALLLMRRHETNPSPADQKSPRSNPGVTGRIAAQSYCQTCHAVPDPETLDRKTWRDELLPKMRFFTGLTPPNTNFSKDLDVLLAGNVLPKAPLMTEKTWDAIVDYYVSAAPEKLVSTQEQEKIAVGLKYFTTIPAPFRPGSGEVRRIPRW